MSMLLTCWILLLPQEPERESERVPVQILVPAQPTTPVQPGRPTEQAGRGQQRVDARQAEKGLIWEDEDDRAAFEGFVIRSEDDEYKLAVTGKLDNDWAFFSADRDVEAVAGPFEDGTEFRRARIGLKGQMSDFLRFRVNIDLADESAGFRDVYLEMRDLTPLGHLRIGQFREPFSIENRTSSSNITFMERSLPNELAPGRNAGIMSYNDFLDKRATYAVGVFRETDSKAFGVDEGSGKELGLTARLTTAPWYEDDGRRTLHFGGALSFRNPDEDQVRFRERPESNLAPRVVDTGLIPADRLLVGTADAAVVLGPASFQGEIAHAEVDQGAGPSPGFTGYSVQGSYFLTGEHRPYKRKTGNFGTVVPRSDVFDGGHGAWELATRFSSLDLSDSGVTGGEVRDLSFGVNWYLNPNARFQLNYVISDLETVGNARIVQFRFHLDW